MRIDLREIHYQCSTVDSKLQPSNHWYMYFQCFICFTLHCLAKDIRNILYSSQYVGHVWKILFSVQCTVGVIGTLLRMIIYSRKLTHLWVIVHIRQKVSELWLIRSDLKVRFELVYFRSVLTWAANYRQLRPIWFTKINDSI